MTDSHSNLPLVFTGLYMNSETMDTMTMSRCVCSQLTEDHHMETKSKDA